MQEPRQKATLKDYGHAFVELLKNRNYVLLILISIFQNFALTIGKSPLVPFAMTMGIAAPIAGAMNGTYYLLVCIVRPFTGIAQDKINKKVMLTASLAIKAIAFVMIAFSHDYATYFAGRMVDAISFSLITTVFMSTTSLFIDRRTMGIGVGLFSGIPTLVVSAVPTLSMYIFKTYGGKYVYLAGAVALVVGILFVFMLKFPKEEKPAQKKKFSINDIVYLPAIPACMLNFFLAMLLTICDTYLVVMATERGIEGAEIYLTIKSLVNVVAGLGLGGLSDIMGSRKILIGACIATAVASVMYGCAQSLVLIIIASVIYSVFQRGTVPVLIKAAAESAPPELRGAAVSTNYFIQDLAGVFGGYIAALFGTYLGYAGAFYASAAFPIIGMILYIVIDGQKKRTIPQDHALN